MRGEGIRGAAERVVVEGPYQARDQVREGTQCKHGAVGHIRNLTHDVSATLPQADADAIHADKVRIVLVGTAVHDPAGEGLEPGDLGLICGLVSARAYCDIVVESLVDRLAVCPLHHDVPAAGLALDGEHFRAEADVLLETEGPGILLQVLLVLGVVPVEAVPLRGEVRERHQVVADGERSIVIHTVLALPIIEDAPNVAILLEAIDVGDFVVPQLLDRRQAARAGANDADSNLRHASGVCRAPTRISPPRLR
mmetsp:Transcript_30347/g.86817  ORF Transcript_30347/g.86817 Transcript_30347/m.86817 type:complete len:253 (+) Transcript_30347:1108-1866(+)